MCCKGYMGYREQMLKDGILIATVPININSSTIQGKIEITSKGFVQPRNKKLYPLLFFAGQSCKPDINIRLLAGQSRKKRGKHCP